MTAVAEDLDLSWVTFSGDHPAEPCHWTVDGPCPLEVVARATWLAACGCAPSSTFYCARHRDVVLERERLRWGWRCRHCDGPVQLLRMEPAR